MTRIDGPSPSGPPRPEGKRPVTRSSPTQPGFAERIEQVQGASPSPGSDDPRAQRMRALILEGLDADLSRENILRTVVQDELERSFGASRNDEMTESVTTAFLENRDLRALFDRLFEQVGRERNSG